MSEETKTESRWENFGDINFLEHGGCLVRHSFAKEELVVHPTLKNTFDVLRVITDTGEEGMVFAELHFIDTDDYANDPEKKQEIFTAIGLEKSADKPVEDIMSLARFAVEVADYGYADYVTHYGSAYGTASGSEGCLITEEELKDWIRQLGAADCIGLDSDKEPEELEDPFDGTVPLEVWVWDTKNEVLYVMQDGDGSQLDEEDYRDGYDSYVDYTTYLYSGDDCIFTVRAERLSELYRDEDEDFTEEDGGCMMYAEKDCSVWTDKIADVIRFNSELDDDEPVEYKILGFE